ncbi:UNVERIFIED_CONTAM: hypothetical protein FKN15_054435 [Acipenser sinensis]
MAQVLELLSRQQGPAAPAAAPAPSLPAPVQAPVSPRGVQDPVKMDMELKMITVFWGVILIVQSSFGTRVVSGQTVCYGGPKHPCYKIAYFPDMSSRVAFKEAWNACEIDGGALLSIDSEAEQRLIEKLLQDLTQSGSGMFDGDFWIGLTRNGEGHGHNAFTGCPDLYKWTDGSVSEFRNWYYDEPSCGGEACVVMYHQPTAQHGLGGAYLYQWNDDRCNMKHNFICKYEPVMAESSASPYRINTFYFIKSNEIC